MNDKKFQSSREMLLFDYNIRREKNPRFSRRAYAKHLGVSPGRLTDILSGKSPLTEKRARLLLSKLSFDRAQKTLFLQLAENEFYGRTSNRKKRKSYRIGFDEFALVSDWEYFSLMSLIETSTFKSDPAWISRKLGVSEKRLQEVLNNLIETNMVKVNEEGMISNTYHSMSTLTDIPSEILRKANVDCILQGIQKMQEVDILARDVTSMTFPVDPAKIKEAKMLIRKFKSKMADLMADSPTSEIYNLNIQFVPVSQLGV